MNTRLLLVAATWAALAGASPSGADAQAGVAETRFTLTGVVFVAGGAGRAWLQEARLTHDQVVSVRVGDGIGPYRLAKILEDRVELEGPTGTLVVLLLGTSGAPIVDLEDPRRTFDFGAIFGVEIGFASD